MTAVCSSGENEGRPSIVFFDAGNTLLHVHPSIGEVYAEVCESYGCTVPPEELERHLLEVWKEYQTQQHRQAGDGLRTSEAGEYEMWRKLTYALHERVPALTCDRRPWFEALHETFGEARRFRMFPDVADTLGALQEMGIRIGVISNWDSRLESILDGIGLRRRLDVVVISSLVGYSKPHPRIFEIALERSGMGPEEAVHVGDTFRDDVEGAQAAGIKAILVRRAESIGVASRYLLSGRPSPDCTTVASLTELPALLSNGGEPSSSL